MAKISLQKLIKNYTNQTVVHGIDLEIQPGEFVVLVGPSGCGKSTTLRMIAGLETVTSGKIMIGDEIVNDLAPKDRHIAMVFQNYALYPHMSVYENMAFSLKLRGIAKSEIEKKVQEASQILNLTDYLQRKPNELSGGQRQRVAMGRAIVRNPKVFLFDEPLSNLDAKLRTQMRAEIKKLHARLKTTTVYVTHDQVEAMTLADRIVIMRGGRIEQVGTPLEIYEKPANSFVASFIGSPPMNLIRGEKLLGVRPEHLSLQNISSSMSFSGEIDFLEPLGAETLVHMMYQKQNMVARLEQAEALGLKTGDSITLHASKVQFFDAKSEMSL